MATNKLATTLMNFALPIENMGENATPSNPSANQHKLYFKSDEKLYKLNSSGTEIAIADLNSVQVFQKSQRVSSTVLTSTANSVAVDLAANNDYTHALTENTTLANPTNIVAGQSGAIHITQDTTPRTLAFGSYWKFPGGTAPTVSTGSGVKDTLFYHVRSATEIEARLVQDFS